MNKLTFPDGDGEEVHGGGADESGDEAVGGVAVEFEWRGDLLEDAVVHDGDAIAHGHGFGLVVGDVDGSGFELFLQADDLGAGFGAEFGVEVGEGFVHEEDLGCAGHSSAEGDALFLTAGELFWETGEQIADLKHVGNALDALGDLRF